MAIGEAMKLNYVEPTFNRPDRIGSETDHSLNFW